MPAELHVVMGVAGDQELLAYERTAVPFLDGPKLCCPCLWLQGALRKLGTGTSPACEHPAAPDYFQSARAQAAPSSNSGHAAAPYYFQSARIQGALEAQGTDLTARQGKASAHRAAPEQRRGERVDVGNVGGGVARRQLRWGEGGGAAGTRAQPAGALLDAAPLSFEVAAL
eukprot:1153969-Pelagomonas_calceolata.AAC.2